MDAIAVEVRRGGTVESVHRVHAAAWRGGKPLASWGDPGLFTFWRSAAKPFQALPLVRAVPGIPDAELAIACSSHEAGPAQLQAVRALLVRAGASEDDLECGDRADAASRILHNCSGKHAGMLCLARARGWAPEGYRLPGHPVERAAMHEIVAATGMAEEAVATAVDGCGIVTVALPLERMAAAYARLPELEGAGRVVAAMTGNPRLVGGPGIEDTDAMEALPGWLAKRGAEGILCLLAPDGTGIALKVEDGAPRASKPALARVLAGLGLDAPAQLASTPLENSRGETVGEITAA